MFKINEIRGGNRSDIVAVYCDETNIQEISCDVANAFVWSYNFDWVACIQDLRCSADDRRELFDLFPNISEEAYKAILDANIRGVQVGIIAKNKERRDASREKVCEYNFIHSRFASCSEREKKRFLKILGLNEDYKWFP